MAKRKKPERIPTPATIRNIPARNLQNNPTVIRHAYKDLAKQREIAKEAKFSKKPRKRK